MDLNLADAVLLGIVAVAALIGVLRGLVGIAASTAAWLLSGWCSFQFGRSAALGLSEAGNPTALQWLGGYALTFIAVFVTISVLGVLLRLLVRTAELGSADRILGGITGLACGIAISAVLVLLMGFTPLRDDPDWDKSPSVAAFTPLAGWMRDQLPDRDSLLRPLDNAWSADPGDTVQPGHADAASPQPVPVDAPAP